MGKCSICQGTGHNSRTCPQKSVTTLTSTSITKKVGMGVNTTPRKSTFSTSATPKLGTATPTKKLEIIPTPLKPPLTNNRGNSSDPHKRVQITQPTNPIKIPEVRYPAQFYPAQRIEAVKEREKVIKTKDSDLIKKIEKLPIPKTLMIHTSNFCNSCHNHGHLQEQCKSSSPTPRNDRYDKKCSQCGQQEHNVKTCPQLEDKRKEEKVLKTKPASWLNSSARNRFAKGPTATDVSDGAGYIYMYTYSVPKSEGDKNLFKIGMSKDIPKRRIEVQETRNKEHYQSHFHEETPYRYLTENVIHLHLEEVRDPREAGDGRTEWFRGSPEYFVRVIKDVIKEVKIAIQNEFFETSPPTRDIK